MMVMMLSVGLISNFVILEGWHKGPQRAQTLTQTQTLCCRVCRGSCYATAGQTHTGPLLYRLITGYKWGERYARQTSMLTGGVSDGGITGESSSASASAVSAAGLVIVVVVVSVVVSAGVVVVWRSASACACAQFFCFFLPVSTQHLVTIIPPSVSQPAGQSIYQSINQ